FCCCCLAHRVCRNYQRALASLPKNYAKGSRATKTKIKKVKLDLYKTSSTPAKAGVVFMFYCALYLYHCEITGEVWHAPCSLYLQQKAKTAKNIIGTNRDKPDWLVFRFITSVECTGTRAG